MRLALGCVEIQQGTGDDAVVDARQQTAEAGDENEGRDDSPAAAAVRLRCGCSWCCCNGVPCRRLRPVSRAASSTAIGRGARGICASRRWRRRSRNHSRGLSKPLRRSQGRSTATHNLTPWVGLTASMRQSDTFGFHLAGLPTHGRGHGRAACLMDDALRRRRHARRNCEYGCLISCRRPPAFR